MNRRWTTRVALLSYRATNAASIAGAPRLERTARTDPPPVVETARTRVVNAIELNMVLWILGYYCCFGFIFAEPIRYCSSGTSIDVLLELQANIMCQIRSKEIIFDNDMYTLYPIDGEITSKFVIPTHGGANANPYLLCLFHDTASCTSSTNGPTKATNNHSSAGYGH